MTGPQGTSACGSSPEGVETLEMFNELKTLGCDIAQGYLLSRPLPAADLTALAKDWRSAKEGTLVSVAP